MNISRSQFLKSGLGLASIIATCQSPAIIVKSMLANRSNITSEYDENNFPYVSRGLVAMWDGIWNSGLGIHSNDENDFIDLMSKQKCIVAPWCGSYRNTDCPEYAVVENGLQSYTSGLDIGVAIPFQYDDFFGKDIYTNYRRKNFTIEVVRTLINAEKTSGRRAGIFVAANNGGTTTQKGGDLFTWTNSKNLVVSYSGETTIGTEVTNGCSIVQYASSDDNVIALHNGNIFNRSGFWHLQHNYQYVGISTSGYEATLHGFRIYNRQLSIEEMAYNYEVDTERFNLQ